MNYEWLSLQHLPCRFWYLFLGTGAPCRSNGISVVIKTGKQATDVKSTLRKMIGKLIQWESSGIILRRRDWKIFKQIIDVIEFMHISFHVPNRFIFVLTLMVMFPPLHFYFLFFFFFSNTIFTCYSSFRFCARPWLLHIKQVTWKSQATFLGVLNVGPHACELFVWNRSEWYAWHCHSILFFFKYYFMFWFLVGHVLESDVNHIFRECN